ncbi:MAG: PKD domain-containing protein [Bacteroidia bacterium]|nr:PKD domain-containing protein [Bacteroidia bacterium]
MTSSTESSFRKFFFLILLISATNTLRAQVPVASFTASQDSGCAPLQVNFSNTSTGAISYQWNLGNGNNSSLQNPSTSYINPGSYTVVLIATSGTGQKDTTSAVITILGDPTADFSASPLSACSNNNLIAFTNLSAGSGTYIWDFGDGSSSTAVNPVHPYSVPGTYNVKLIASNSFGCQDIEIKNNYLTIHPAPQAQISVSQSSACDINTIFQFSGSGSGISTWSWNFGDGGTSTQQNPSHQYSAPGNYPVSLVVTSANGCSDTVQASNNISIGNSLVPSFTMNDSAGCGPFTVQFDCTVPNATSWSWNFGDGSTSSLDNPSHTYTAPGSYTISLSVTTSSGCNGSVSIPALVTVDAVPVVNFTVVQDSGCAPFTAQFINLSSGASSYSWQFGNSDSSTLPNPSTTYNLGGYFSVTLTATSPNGCRASVTKSQIVRVFAPTAAFTASPRIGCPGMTVQFTHTGNPINIISYLWNFGDGSSSTLQNPSHTYTAIGTYTVWLVINNSFGCQDTVYKSNYITVVSGQTAYTVPDTLLVCEDNPIAFSDPTTGSNTWNWNFGNGSGSTSQSPSVIYTTPGIYTVTLQTSMPGGCSQTFNPYAIVKVIPHTPRPIDLNFISSCKPYVVSFSTQTPNITAYSWDFGDGSTSTLASPAHTYQQAGTYAVVLTITVGEGCITTINTTLTLGHSNPMQVSAQDACLGAVLAFSLSNPAAFSSATWNFGDGNFATSLQPVHSYATAGVYPVTVYTTDTASCIDTFTLALPITINNPIPAFSVSNVACINSSVSFQNLSQNAGSYLWNFGDGSTSTDSFPVHSYAQTGTYTIGLTATQNSCSVTYTANAWLTIASPNSQFNFSTNGQCMPITVSFNDQSSGGPVQWLWHFGNGDSSAQQNPVYSYSTDPADSIQLIITDANGCRDTSRLAPFPYYAAAATVDDSTGCIPHTVQFSDLSNGAIRWTWDFGDGGNSSLQHPTHQYTANGTYTVRLVAEFPGGCFDTIVYNNMISIASPQANFFSPSMAGCSPTQISFVNATSDATIFNWSFGDGGSSSNINPQHIYYIPGTYTVTLIASNTYGCSDTMVRQDYISIPGTYTLFGISTLSGCQGQGIQFTDSSINANQWSWDFGDGAIDSVQHPNHAYPDTGNYTVTLITRDTLGCTSSYIYPLSISIHPVPSALATVTDSVGCSSFSTGFINLSQGAVQYLWNFGDGDTSTGVQPGHTYLSGGVYYPELIALTGFGCSDTFSFNTGINVLQTPQAIISASDTTGCEPVSITFTSTSLDTQSPSYNWYNDNGNTGNTPVFQPLFLNDSVYSVMLVITNGNGCSDTVTQQVTIHPSPVAGGSADLSSGCHPLPVQFTNSSVGAGTYTWYFGNGDSSTLPDPTYTYLVPGYYQPTLIAVNAFGCSDTFTFNPGIDVRMTPTASFSISSQLACYNEAVQFTTLSSDTLSASYQWDFGFSISSAPSPSIVCTVPGIYDISLIVTNANGCADTILQSAYLEVADTIAPSINPIASASVLNDQEVIVTWFNSNEADIAAYRLYRLNAAGSAWDLIYTDSFPVLAGTASTSSYTDQNLDTRNNSYSYRLQTVDRCGYMEPLQNLTAHTTMNIEATASGMIMDVNWTAYTACGIGTYRLYRTERPNGSPVLLATLPASVLQFTDTTIICPLEYEYRVEATDICGTVYNAFSDTSAAWPENIFENQQSEIVRSTVIDNQTVLTEWLAPSVLPDRVLEYRIYKSSDSTNYSLLAVTPAGITSYLDTDADVQDSSYIYKVVVVNDCNLSGPESNAGKSILLRGRWKDHRTYLNWSKYLEWGSGIDHYTIEFLSPQGTWIPVQTVDGNTLSTEIDD